MVVHRGVNGSDNPIIITGRVEDFYNASLLDLRSDCKTSLAHRRELYVISEFDRVKILKIFCPHPCLASGEMCAGMSGM
jgi:hypothetical protein